MNKSELTERVAQHFPDLRSLVVDKACRAVLDEISLALTKGDRVEIRGLCSLQTVGRQPRKGLNPATGVPISVGPRRHVRMKAGKALLRRLNGAGSGSGS